MKEWQKDAMYYPDDIGPRAARRPKEDRDGAEARDREDSPARRVYRLKRNTGYRTPEACRGREVFHRVQGAVSGVMQEPFCRRDPNEQMMSYSAVSNYERLLVAAGSLDSADRYISRALRMIAEAAESVSGTSRQKLICAHQYSLDFFRDGLMRTQILLLRDAGEVE